MKPRGLYLVLSSLALLSACACSPRSGRGPEALVVGHVLDASTGEPLAGVKVEGPHGVHTVSGRDGRFELHLAAGDEGPVKAATPDGRSGEDVLRPLEAGRLEIVLQLSKRRAR